jgi:hypothetical protein
VQTNRGGRNHHLRYINKIILKYPAECVGGMQEIERRGKIKEERSI